MKYNKDLRSGNVDKADYHDPSKNLIDQETLKFYHFDVRKKHHLPIEQKTFKGYSLNEVIDQIKKKYVWFRQRHSPPTR